MTKQFLRLVTSLYFLLTTITNRSLSVSLFLDANITKLDLVFALSATTSSFIQTYNLMRNTVNRFINTYGVNKIHYSIIVYGNQVSRVVNFNHTFPQSANELKTAINAQPSLPGPTVLRNALAETFRIFNETEGRPGAKKVLVVITDSNSPSDNSNTLTAAVRPLENKKVLVISVAIGNVNRSELLVISPNPLDVISVQSNVDFGVLSEWIMDRILRRKGLLLFMLLCSLIKVFKHILRAMRDKMCVVRGKKSMIQAPSFFPNEFRDGLEIYCRQYNSKQQRT